MTDIEARLIEISKPRSEMVCKYYVQTRPHVYEVFIVLAAKNEVKHYMASSLPDQYLMINYTSNINDIIKRAGYDPNENRIFTFVFNTPYRSKK